MNSFVAFRRRCLLESRGHALWLEFSNGYLEDDMAMRRLTVDSWEAMVKSLETSATRQRKILQETEGRLDVSREMLEQARKESAQSDLVSQASNKKP